MEEQQLHDTCTSLVLPCGSVKAACESEKRSAKADADSRLDFGRLWKRVKMSLRGAPPTFRSNPAGRAWRAERRTSGDKGLPRRLWKNAHLIYYISVSGSDWLKESCRSTIFLPVLIYAQTRLVAWCLMVIALAHARDN